VDYDRAALRVATGGAIMRGPATIYEGKLFRQTLDAHVVALDMKTGLVFGRRETRPPR
jgi:alcohol dehydrogenase (cytochrome c)